MSLWILCLNDMRSAQVEILRPICRAATREELEVFIAAEQVPDYKDGTWAKVYRKGGPLEWFNPPWRHDNHKHFVDVGDQEEAAQRAAGRAREWWTQAIGPISNVSSVRAESANV